MIEELQRQLETLRIENRKLKAAYDRLHRPMSGISVCATKCGCCEMLNQIASNALKEANAIWCDHDWWHGGERAFCRTCLAERVV
jgi:hypothetical protein